MHWNSSFWKTVGGYWVICRQVKSLCSVKHLEFKTQLSLVKNPKKRGNNSEVRQSWESLISMVTCNIHVLCRRQDFLVTQGQTFVTLDHQVLPEHSPSPGIKKRWKMKCLLWSQFQLSFVVSTECWLLDPTSFAREI